MHLPLQSPTLPYFLGCPVWACGDWAGNLFTSAVRKHEYLHQYSMAFNTVEGNSTFYGLPSLDTVRRWCDEALPGFRFALKFPRAISHDRQLVHAESETRAFLTILELLAASDHLGPSFLQLGPSFNGLQLPQLAAYLRELPEEFPFALEVRHEDFFDHGPHEQALDELLTRLQIDRAIFDSRALFSAPPHDEHEVEAQRRKPNSPLRQTITGQHPLLRFVGRNDVVAAQPWIEEWAPVVARWIRSGLTPYVFAHTPHDRHAPELARAFHQELARHIPELPPLPAWPGAAAASVKRQQQRELF
ncbi:MAG: DUF72 domain-containing protein [Planctomycetes bacterium]|nr:DUF72 domain-containing protein [Planctomycetota bacterium]